MFNNIRKNIMGTTSFDAKFGRMRKAQSFIVYPINNETEIIRVQSDKRWAEINLTTNTIMLSSNHNYANSMALMIDIAKGKSERITFIDTDIKPLLDAIRKTASPMAGGNNCLSMYCDNSKANLI